MISSRTGWSNLAIIALCLAITSGSVVPYSHGWWWLLRAIAVGGFAVAAVRCTINAAHAPERRYTR